MLLLFADYQTIMRVVLLLLVGFVLLSDSSDVGSGSGEELAGSGLFSGSGSGSGAGTLHDIFLALFYILQTQQ